MAILKKLCVQAVFQQSKRNKFKGCEIGFKILIWRRMASQWVHGVGSIFECWIKFLPSGQNLKKGDV